MTKERVKPISKTRKLVNKELDNDHYIEDYKREFEKELEAEYQKVLKNILSLIRPFVGLRITKRQAQQLKRAVEQLIKDYTDKVISKAKEEFPELGEIYWDSLNEMLSEVEDEFKGQEYSPVSNMFSRQVPLNNKKVGSIETMLISASALFLANMESLIDRMNVLEQDTEQLIGLQYDSAAGRFVKDTKTVSASAIATAIALIRESFFKKNNSIVGHIHVSVLDAATTQYCLDRHNQFWRYDKPELSTLPDSTPPGTGHYNCRSTGIPLLRGEVVEELPTYEEWFEELPASRKEEILGKRRYELYAKGDIRIQDISDGQGNRLSLDELRQVIRN